MTTRLRMNYLHVPSTCMSAWRLNIALAHTGLMNFQTMMILTIFSLPFSTQHFPQSICTVPWLQTWRSQLQPISTALFWMPTFIIWMAPFWPLNIWVRSTPIIRNALFWSRRYPSTSSRTFMRTSTSPTTSQLAPNCTTWLPLMQWIAKHQQLCTLLPLLGTTKSHRQNNRSSCCLPLRNVLDVTQVACAISAANQDT